MKVVIFTAHDTAYAEMADVTRPTLERYATKHGYELVYDPNVPEQEKDACKARIFGELYRSGEYGPDDIAMWIDTDALIMNSEVKPLPMWNSEHFVWSYDWNGPNSGVWIARFSSQAMHFIQTYDYLARAMGWGDNWAMNQTMLLPPFNGWVTCHPGKTMNCNLYDAHGMGDWAHKNSINNYEPGDFILHLAGVEHSLRMELLRKYAALAK